MTVPYWNAAGLLPPHDVNNPVSNLRSPYLVTVADLVASLTRTRQRREIAEGFLRYRAGLHALGFRTGFQWVDGSFCTDVETLEARPPGDIDVVTFLETPTGMDRQAAFVAHPELFISEESKRVFSCDAYIVDFNGASPEFLIAASAYWSSVWGHTRGGIWKGFLQVSLDPEFDELARNLLEVDEVAA